MYENILVALDGSELAEQSLPHVQALAEKFGSTVTLLRAMLAPEALIPPTGMAMPMGDMAAYSTILSPGSMEDYDAMLDAERSEATTYLGGVAERLKGLGLNVVTEQIEGSAADVIIERAKGLSAGLIAMTTHGRSGLARALVGSVVDEVVRHSSCPVLLVRVQ